MATTVETLITEYKATIGDYEVKTRRVISMTEQVGQKAGEAEQSIKRLGSAMHAIAAATNGINSAIELFSRLAEVMRTPFDAAIRFDKLMRGLESVAGSAEAAQKQFQSLKEVAKTPGLGLEEAIQGSIRLQAAGFSARNAERALKSFGNALAAVGRGKTELDGVTIALTQILSKGKVSAEEINQLAERLPQIRRAMVGAFGTSDTEKLQKMGISAERFIGSIIDQFEKLKPITGSIANDMENVGDKITIAFASAGRVLLPIAREILPRISALMDQITPMFDRLANVTDSMGKSGGLKAFAATLVGDFQRLNFVISATVGIIAGLAAGALVAGLFRLVAVFKQIYEVVKSVGLAALLISGLSRNFVGIFAGLAAVTAGGAAFMLMEQRMNQMWAESPVAGIAGKGAESVSDVAKNAMALATAGAGGPSTTGAGSPFPRPDPSGNAAAEAFNRAMFPILMAGKMGGGDGLTPGGVDAAVRQQKRADEIARLIAASPEWMKHSGRPVDALTQIERNTKAAALGLQNLASALFGGGARASLGLSLADIGPMAPGRRGGSPSSGQIKIELGSAVTEFERVAQRMISDAIDSLARQGVFGAPAIGGRIS